MIYQFQLTAAQAKGLIDAGEMYIVKDHGAYVMPANMTQEDKSCLVYADGHNPEVDEDWWVGGDDYAERVPSRVLTPKAGCLEVILTATQIKMSYRTNA